MADVPGNSSTTSTLTVGGSAVNTLESNGDHDWFALNVTAGQQITVTIYGITLEDSLLNIRGSAGQILFSNDDIKAGSDRNSKVTFTPSTSGVVYIDVGAFHDAYSGTYQVSVQSGTTPPLATVDTIAGYLVQGYWGGDEHHFAATQGGTITVNLSTLNLDEQKLARTALQEWSDIIGVDFQEVTTGAQITFDNTEDSSGNPVAATDAQWSNGITSSAHVHISSSWVNRYGTSLNSYSFQTYLHEIGHALGLGHGGDYNGDATYSTDALFQNDAWSTTVMSYFDERQNTYFGNQGFSRDFAVTPMEADIAAMQTLYGLSTTTRTGNTIYGFNSNAGGVYDARVYPNVALTIFDNGGNDTLDYSGSGLSQLINLNPETFSNVNGQIGNLSIARGTVIENAIGGSGADTLIGNLASNVLTGNGGADTLTGGGGNDVFWDTKSGHNGDTIKDFGAGDSIVFSDATSGSFNFSLTGNTLSFTGGALIFTSGVAGTLVSSAVAGGGVQLTLSASSSPPNSVALHNDFNGDGRSDILWRHDSGLTTEWLGQTNGALADNSASFRVNLGTAWTVGATGDFNGDGRVDILWRHSSGLVSDWLGQANGGFADNGANSAVNPGTSWHIAGVGDFNGDGRSDLLWRHDSGLVTEWLGQANGGFADNSASFLVNPGNSWQVAATGDFNGDGRDDILWRHDSGLVTEWLGQPSGGLADNSAGFAINPGTSWHVVSSGDFNGDGIDDILWRNDNGLVSDWLGQASGKLADNSASFQVNLGASWHISDIGDFNGDGRSDILWRNDNGLASDWLGQANGGFADNGANSAINPGTSWHVIDPAVHDPFAIG